MIQGGLVLEGGGTRAVYSTGVIDFFIEKDIEFSSVYGVSAGAVHACSYLSKQKYRARDLFIEYINDDRYASFKNLIKTGDYFGKEFSLKEIPNKLLPYDFETYKKSQSKFYAVVTNVGTGKAEYLQVHDMDDAGLENVWASGSLPLMSRLVEINGNKYLDGGVADSIPVLKSLEDGNEKTVVVCTQHKDYVKEPNKLISAIKFKYRKYPEFVKAMENRHIFYNKTMEEINRLEAEGKIFVIRPKMPATVGRLEKDKEILHKWYQTGYDDAKEAYDRMMDFINK
ncbi:MAG: patatin family protein [Lachnospiraceae bacterium]|nr:patatin family protein [Lachnospiraceae bacterium]